MNQDHPLTVCERVPKWVHNEMTEMGYELMPCSWANALYEWHNSDSDTPFHTVEMFFFNHGLQARILITTHGHEYLNGFIRDGDKEALRTHIAERRTQLHRLTDIDEIPNP